MEKIVILTGAGISAESGLATFRDEGGLWAAHRIEDVATPEAFERDPDLVHRFYNARRAQAARVAPNAAHRALARLQERHGGEVVLVTQNVDALHEAAGSRAVMHMHGTLAGALCARCEARWPAPLVMSTQDACPVCGAKATRPDIVWFGEMPHGMEAIWTHLEEADVFAAIGTSGNVYPAAAFAQHAGRAGAHTIELNLEASYNTRDFAETRLGRASQVGP
uniref:NAD-dependent deacylase n=2 Tax=Roseovarius TaxID=74030 RepID=UPI003A981C02